jgi:2-oxoglutarate ferredoxin oxidoreductase subunit alpha
MTYNGQRWGRYLDVDGDGIPYRTLPGTDQPGMRRTSRAARVTPNTPPTASVRTNGKRTCSGLARKFETARTLVPAPSHRRGGRRHDRHHQHGQQRPAIVEARARLRDQGSRAAILRVRALPINEEVRAFVEKHDTVYVVENNRDGQLCEILLVDLHEVEPQARLRRQVRWVAALGALDYRTDCQVNEES